MRPFVKYGLLAGLVILMLGMVNTLLISNEIIIPFFQYFGLLVLAAAMFRVVQLKRQELGSPTSFGQSWLAAMKTGICSALIFFVIMYCYLKYNQMPVSSQAELLKEYSSDPEMMKMMEEISRPFLRTVTMGLRSVFNAAIIALIVAAVTIKLKPKNS